MTYVVSKYDIADDPCKDGDWTEVARVESKWALRPVLRDLYDRGYSNMSVAVDLDDTPAQGIPAPTHCPREEL